MKLYSKDKWKKNHTKSSTFSLSSLSDKYLNFSRKTLDDILPESSLLGLVLVSGVTWS